MELDTLRTFLGWCLTINLALYMLAVVAVLTCRPWVTRLQSRMFGLDERVVGPVLYGYLAVYKLLILVFNFAPYLALVAMTR